MYKKTYIKKLKQFKTQPFKIKHVWFDTKVENVGESVAGQFISQVFPGITNKKQGARLIIRFDGDGDRVMFFNQNNKQINSSFVTLLLGKFLTGGVVVEPRTSRAVWDNLKDVRLSKCWGGEIKSYMEKHKDVVLGAETSGHYYFRDFYNIDDGLLAVLIFLQAYNEKLLAKLEKNYFIIPETNFTFTSKAKQNQVLHNLEKYFKDKNKVKINKLDGLSIDFPNWRFNIRPSKTEPVLRLNLEADNKQLMEEKKQHLVKLINF